MKIFSKTTRHILAGGMLFIIPLTLIIVLVGKILDLLRPLAIKIEPVFGSHTILGVTSVTLIGAVLMVLLCYLAGILIQKGIINFWGQRVEMTFFRLFPSLQMMKFMMVDEDELKTISWKAFLYPEGESHRIAFITDDSQPDHYAVFIPDAPRMDAGEVRYIRKDSITINEITFKQAISAIYNYGQGMEIS